MSLIVEFWRFAIEHGHMPRAVWATVSFGGEQPVGHIIGWSVSKRAALADVDKRSNAGDWRLVKIEPPLSLSQR